MLAYNFYTVVIRDDNMSGWTWILSTRTPIQKKKHLLITYQFIRWASILKILADFLKQTDIRMYS